LRAQFIVKLLSLIKVDRIYVRLTFGVGPRELRGFRMIERHYFRDQVQTGNNVLLT
jgi:GMP-PDE, delta subunit